MTEVCSITFDGGDAGRVGESCVADARDWCRSTAVAARLDPAELVEDMLLVVSELVSNAVRAHAAGVALTLSIDDHHVEVAVGDDADGSPQPQDAAATDTHGRGLRIVDAVSTDWGVRPGDHGKWVWATLDAPVLLSA